MKIFNHICTALFLLFLSGAISPIAHADSQSLSVTPPLFQLSIDPGGAWQSVVRVVNNNPYPLTVYARVVNFAPEGEEGRGRFMPLLNHDEDKATLAEWIFVSEGPYVVPPEQTQEIPVLVDVPKDASPGGHFAAILVGTEPPLGSTESLAVLTSQSVASLFFVRVEGDVVENATIREFSILDRSIEYPAAEFSLRFENKGNVHLQPRGNIIITNMWGKTRGMIPINQESHFGNVLPQSIRDFRFSWKGERSLADIGLYKAIVTLGYGEDEVKSTSAAAYFWVIPIKGALITLVVILLFVYAITWMIRRYVRNMLMLAGVDPDEPAPKHPVSKTISKRDVKIGSYQTMAAPIQQGALDLRTRLRDTSERLDTLRTIITFIINYKIFFLSLLVVIVGFIVAVRYIGEVSSSSRTYEVTIDQGDTTRTLKSSEIEQTQN